MKRQNRIKINLAYIAIGIMLLLAAMPCLSQAPALQQKLYGASLGPEIANSQSVGDTWYATWADDGNLYVTSDDTSGWNGKCLNKTRPYVFVAISQLHGDDPKQLHGESINCLDEYATASHLKPNMSWKTSGITSVDGVLYLALQQDTYTDSNNSGRETARDGIIIKSLDHGRTWSGSEAASMAQPMFPGETFSAPSFIQYGRDGAGGVDGGDRYVYAISNDGSWDNGNLLVLGRVRRSGLPALRGSDWEFYADGHWVRDRLQARPILSDPHRLGSVSIVYDPALKSYLLASWYYPGCTGYVQPGCDVHRSRWVWYQAPKPWGPWARVQQFEWYPAGYYNPILVNKFLGADGLSGWVFSAGYFWDRTWYRFTAAPFTLDRNPIQLVNDSDTKMIDYAGPWTYTRASMGEVRDDLHYTTRNGASATFHFKGCGVRVLTDFVSDRGVVDVYLDGKLRGSPSAHIDSPQGIQFAQRTLWNAQELPKGSHSLKLQKKSGNYMIVDAFIVSNCSSQ